MRCTHEAQIAKRNSFVTLTLEDAALQLFEMDPERPRHTVEKRDLQLFHKKLRKGGTRYRYFGVGEYGDDYLRPHYHLLIFGQDFQEDRALWEHDESGRPCYRSPRLAAAWPWGIHEIKDLSPEAISYVCRYTMKKITGSTEAALQLRAKRYERVDPETGEVWRVNPEFAAMSRGGKNGKGIGSLWYEKFKADLFPGDFALISGREVPVPKYYGEKLKKEDPELHQALKERRHKLTAGREWDRTPERRLVREKITEAKMAVKKARNLGSVPGRSTGKVQKG